jgi:hypothetical protein
MHKRALGGPHGFPLIQRPLFLPPDARLALRGAEDTMPHVVQGRLTLTPFQPMGTSEVTDGTALYFWPLDGNVMRVWDKRWKYQEFEPLGIAVPALRNTDFDVFIEYPCKRLVTVAWLAPDGGNVTSISNASPPVVTTSAVNPLADDQLVTINGNAVSAMNATWRINQLTTTT